MRSLLSAIAACALLSSAAAAADRLTPAEIAQIESEQAKAQKAIEKKFGNKQSSELTNEERRQMIRETQAADSEIFGKHGVTAKDFAISATKITRAERAAADDARAAIAAREEAEQANAGKQPAQQEPEVQVIRGTSDDAPLEVFRDENAVDVERPNEDGLVETDGENPAAIDAERTQPLEIDTSKEP